MSHLYLVAAGQRDADRVLRRQLSGLPAVAGHAREHSGRQQQDDACPRSIAGVVGPGLTGVLIGGHHRAHGDPVRCAFVRRARRYPFGSSASRSRGRCPARTPHIGREILEGLRASWHEPILRTLLLRAATSAVFLGFGSSLYILFAVRELRIGAVLLGVVIAVGGCSGVFGALTAGAWCADSGLAAR